MPIQIFQAEWCPYSHRVRQRLTELGVDFLVRQVEADPDDRKELQRVSGQTSIPVLVDRDDVIDGPDKIIAWLDERFEFRDDAAKHRAKAIEDAEELGEPPPPWPG